MILDFGCGDGTWLKENGGNIAVGIDVNRERLNLAKYHVKNGTSFILCDGCHLPFKSDCFTYVYISLTLHHVQDFKKAISEVYRVLRGVVEIEEVIDNYFLFAMSRKLFRHWRGMPIHSFFSSDNLIDVLRRNFKIIKVRYRNFLLLSHLMSYLSIRSKFVSYLDYLYDSVLHSFRLSKYFSSRVKIVASNMHIELYRY